MNTIAPALSGITIPRTLSTVLVGLCLLGAVALILWPIVLPSLQDLCAATTLIADGRCATAPNKLLGYVAMISAFPAILVLERLWPAAESQSRFSAGLLVDFVWFCFAPVVLVAILIPVEDLLRWVYGSYLGLGKFEVIGSLPLALQFAVVILLSDFMSWVAHVVRHKSSFAWEFHAIHHSQEELNYFSTARIHPGDAITIMLVRFLPFALLDASIAVPAFVVWTSFARVYEMYTHSNIRTNMGPLKYVLVTPQSHRIHHSDLPEHKDKNFANVFSIWDFIFRTQCLDFGTYPRTGIQDKNVPRPVQPTLLGAVAAYGKLLVYPFTALFRRSGA
jgi:sterol desaturase/sphingolipid hydroxylase (fatty acid hydroxylase superfamily)